MSTVNRTAGAPGSITLTTANSGGQLIVPVAQPSVAWFTDPARTLGGWALNVTGSGSTYTASWGGPDAPATNEVRYLRVTVETSPGIYSVDVNDEIHFESAIVTVGTQDYTTLPALKADLGISDDDDDPALSSAITAASRAVDRMTGTTFYPITEARTFMAGDDGSVWVDRFTSVGGLAVATGSDGTYPTTVATDRYVLWPYNAPSRGLAYERIDFPGHSYPLTYGRPTVQVTASWGWHFVPPEVERATRLKAARLFRRKDSPDGVAGTSEFGVLRISQYEDPDVLLLLRPYTDIGIA